MKAGEVYLTCDAFVLHRLPHPIDSFCMVDFQPRRTELFLLDS